MQPLEIFIKAFLSCGGKIGERHHFGRLILVLLFPMVVYRLGSYIKPLGIVCQRFNVASGEVFGCVRNGLAERPEQLYG